MLPYHLVRQCCLTTKATLASVVYGTLSSLPRAASVALPSLFPFHRLCHQSHHTITALAPATLPAYAPAPAPAPARSCGKAEQYLIFLKVFLCIVSCVCGGSVVAYVASKEGELFFTNSLSFVCVEGV